VLSWYEQKAVCYLLSLLYLGVKNMRLGPPCPLSSSPRVAVLQEKFNLMPITTPEEDRGHPRLSPWRSRLREEDVGGGMMPPCVFPKSFVPRKGVSVKARSSSGSNAKAA
jgi:hypothetical protein